MSNPQAFPHSASPDGVLGRLTLTVAAWMAAGAVVASGACTVITPLPIARLLPSASPALPVIARTPVATQVLS